MIKFVRLVYSDLISSTYTVYKKNNLIFQQFISGIINSPVDNIMHSSSWVYLEFYYYPHNILTCKLNSRFNSLVNNVVTF